MLFTLLMCVGQVFAQSTLTGGVTGKVTDPQGAVVPNATIKVTNTGTNSVITVTANDEGAYSATNLQPGTYRLEISSGGFAPSKAEGVVVEVGRATNIDVKLTVGTAVAEVEVNAEAPVINLSDSANSSNVNQTSINELPINGGRWSNFALLTPGAVPDGTFGLISFRGVALTSLAQFRNAEARRAAATLAEIEAVRTGLTCIKRVELMQKPHALP